MVETQTGKLYTGITTDVERRFKEHCGQLGNKKGAKFFRSDAAKCVVYREPRENRSEASQREAVIKKLSRQSKVRLIKVV
jgi:putative endonuclease